MEFFKRFYREPSSDVIAARQLEDAKVKLLEAHMQAEYYTGLVSILQTRVTRLEERSNNPTLNPR